MRLPLRPTLAALTSATLVAGIGVAVAQDAPTDLQIRTLSNRADLISGGDALTEVVLPSGLDPTAVHVSVDGHDVSRDFAVRRNGKFEGRLGGLSDGDHTVSAVAPGHRPVSLTITNHPIGGPVFAGPQIQPWTCGNGSTDPKCLQKPTFAYYYLPAASSTGELGVTGVESMNGLQSYDPANPPPDAFIAQTTTTDGVTVPFIVRQETGYIDRDQYAIATLWQPGKGWSPWAPQKQYNGRLVITHGASCDTEYQSGSAPDVLDAKVLGAGFIVMSHALDNAGHNCNLLTQAEVAGHDQGVRRRPLRRDPVDDRHGLLRRLARAAAGGQRLPRPLPGHHAAVLASPTPGRRRWSTSTTPCCCSTSRTRRAGTRAPCGRPRRSARCIDHPNIGNPVTFTTAIPNSGDPSRSCTGVPKDKVYDADTNPHGVRCTLQDYMVNVVRPAAVGRLRQPAVRQRRHPVRPEGAARRHAVAGAVRRPQHPPRRARHRRQRAAAAVSTPTCRRCSGPTRTGAVNSANNLDKVAIIDLRGPDPGAFHDVYRTYAMRARLQRNFGTAANQILWRGQAPLIGDPTFADDAVLAVDRWLARVDADAPGRAAGARRSARTSPRDVVDRCTDGTGHDVPS